MSRFTAKRARVLYQTGSKFDALVTSGTRSARVAYQRILRRISVSAGYPYLQTSERFPIDKLILDEVTKELIERGFEVKTCVAQHPIVGWESIEVSWL